MPTIDESAKTGRKWIRRELGKLDPHKDYAKIMAIAAEYTRDEHSMHMMSKCALIHVIMPRHGAETIAFTNMELRRPYRRASNTTPYFWTWFINGPDHPDTIASVQKLNSVHSGVAKHVPGNFAHNSDYIYTLGMLAMLAHRRSKKLGLGGLPESMKIANHLFLKEISKHFRREGDLEVEDFPKSFDALERYCDEWERWNHDYSPVSTDICNAVIADYTERWHPRGLRWLGRAMLLFPVPDHVLDHHRIRKPNAFETFAARVILKASMFYKNVIKADPKQPFLATHKPLTNEQVLELDREAKVRADRKGWVKGGKAALGLGKSTHADSASLCPVVNIERLRG